MASSLAAYASSHMDAPLITRDPSANTTDVYAFVDHGKRGKRPKSLVVALAVYPHEEPGSGRIFITSTTMCFTRSTWRPAVMSRRAKLPSAISSSSRHFLKNQNTILVSYLGVVGLDPLVPIQDPIRTCVKPTLSPRSIGIRRSFSARALFRLTIKGTQRPSITRVITATIPPRMVWYQLRNLTDTPRGRSRHSERLRRLRRSERRWLLCGCQRDV